MTPNLHTEPNQNHQSIQVILIAATRMSRKILFSIGEDVVSPSDRSRLLLSFNPKDILHDPVHIYLKFSNLKFSSMLVAPNISLPYNIGVISHMPIVSKQFLCVVMQREAVAAGFQKYRATRFCKGVHID